MQIDEIISVLKEKFTPSVLKALIDKLETKVVFPAGLIVAVKGMASGNAHITVRHRNSGVEELFILNFTHFRKHPLKVNQWK